VASDRSAASSSGARCLSGPGPATPADLIAASAVPVPAPGSPFDLTLYGVEQDGRLRMEILYSTDVYGEERMIGLLDTVARVLAHGLAEPDVPVRDLPMRDLNRAVPVAEPADVQRARPRPTAVRRGAITDLPATPTERAVAGVWCEVLGLPAVGATDSFFDVGGGSLTMVAVQRRLNRLLGLDLRVVDLFRWPTVRTLAAALDARAGDGGNGAIDPAVARAARRGARRRELIRHRRGDQEAPT